MRCLIALLCVLFVLFALSSTGAGATDASLASKPGLIGDTDCRGTVNALDSDEIIRAVLSWSPNLPCAKNGDVNLDGSIDVIDAALIVQFSAGIIDTLPPFEPLSLGEPGTANLTIDSADGVVGEFFPVDLRVVDISEPGLGAWVIDIVYNPEIVVAVECGRPDICRTSPKDGRVRFAGVSADGRTGDVPLGTIRFECLAHGSGDLAVVSVVMADSTEGSPQDMGVSIGTGTVACVQTPPPPTSTPSAAAQPGDVNCDDSVSSIDAALVLQFVAGLLDVLGCEEAADANGDGNLNSVDAALILQYGAGLLSALPP